MMEPGGGAGRTAGGGVSPSRGRPGVVTTVVALGMVGCCAGGMSAVGQTGSPVVSAAAVTEVPLDQQVADAHDYLADVSKAVNRAREELDRVAAALPAAEQRLAGAESGLAEANRAKESAVGLLASAEAVVRETEARVAETQGRVDSLRVRIGAMARQSYMAGDGRRELAVLLGARDPADFAVALEALSRRSRGNNTVLEELTSAQQRLSGELAEMAGLRDEAVRRRDEAAREVAAADRTAAAAVTAKAEVDALVARRASALRTASDHRRSVKRMYDELLAEQRRVARAAREAARREAEKARREEEAARRPTSGGSTKPTPGSSPNAGESVPVTGGLSWPIPGARAGGRTGWRVHPVYGYRSCHTGVDISAGSGTSIRSAGSGTVATVASGGPYGNHTIVAHADGVSTMYAHQSRIAVRSGQRVTAGQVIGYVGSTGWSTGPHLHFEVHVRGVPYDPMGWFGGGSKQRVSCWSG